MNYSSYRTAMQSDFLEGMQPSGEWEMATIFKTNARPKSLIPFDRAVTAKSGKDGSISSSMIVALRDFCVTRGDTCPYSHVTRALYRQTAACFGTTRGTGSYRASAKTAKLDPGSSVTESLSSLAYAGERRKRTVLLSTV